MPSSTCAFVSINLDKGDVSTCALGNMLHGCNQCAPKSHCKTSTCRRLWTVAMLICRGIEGSHSWVSSTFNPPNCILWQQGLWVSLSTGGTRSRPSKSCKNNTAISGNFYSFPKITSFLKNIEILINSCVIFLLFPWKFENRDQVKNTSVFS